MAFSAAGFTTVSAAKRGQAPSVYAYKTNDLAIDVDGSGYFNSLADTLEVGDMIYVFADADSTPTYGFCVVLSNSAGVVDTSNVSSIGTIDSD
jgi:hypothetical protein